MFQNTCTKCSQPFETKNPNRVVCPNCLYPGRGNEPSVMYQAQSGGYQPGYQAGPPRQGYAPAGGGYGQQAPRPAYGDRPAYGQQRPAYGDRPAYNQGAPRPAYGDRPAYGGGQGGPRPAYGQPRPPYGGGQGGPGGRPPYGQARPPYGGGGGFGGGRPRTGPGGPRRMGPPKKLLIPKEILLELETLYMPCLPLPNPDVHEVLAAKLNIEPSKAFFGINLVRMKHKLPKLDYPKRKLAVSPDQLMAIETMYTPYMTMESPPIGIHKIVAKQLKLDEWRVHVAIGLIRKSKNMSRWNTEREDLPDQMKAHLAQLNAEALAADATGDTPKKAPKKLADKPVAVAATVVETAPVAEVTPVADKPKATRKKAVVVEQVVEQVVELPVVEPVIEPVADVSADVAPAPKKRGRPPKAATPVEDAAV
jgi:hypothetical protein